MHRTFALILAAAGGLALAVAGGSASTTARLSVSPPMVIRGNPLTVTGTGFRPNLKVTFRLKRPNSTTTSRIGSTTAGRKGGFRFVKTIARSTSVGLWVVQACQSSCRTKATARFRVAKIKPL